MGSQAKSEILSADRVRVPEAKAAGLRPYWVEGDGPLLVNVSGLDGTGELFFKQATELARSFRVVTFRQRDDGNFTYEDLAEDIAAIVAANSASGSEPRATIVAESFGGGVALTFALRHPEMVVRLVIVNSFPRYRERFRINAAVWLSGLMPFKALWPLRLGASRLGLYL